MYSATKKLVQTEFLAFAMKAFAVLNKGRRLDNDKYLKLLAEVLSEVAAGRTKRLAVSMPPRHGKTFMASICLPAWILAHKSSAKIIVLSYGQDLADKIAYAIRAILRSDWFREAFDTRLAKDRAKVMDFVTTDGGGVRSLSIEGGVTGLGADFIIIDDPVEIKDCDNSKRLQRVNDLFDDEIQTRLDNPKKGGIVVVAHRLSEDDLPGHVLGRVEGAQAAIDRAAGQTYELADGEIWTRCALTRSLSATLNGCATRSSRGSRLSSSRTRAAATACASKQNISPHSCRSYRSVTCPSSSALIQDKKQVPPIASV